MSNKVASVAHLSSQHSTERQMIEIGEFPDDSGIPTTLIFQLVKNKKLFSSSWTRRKVSTDTEVGLLNSTRMPKCHRLAYTQTHTHTQKNLEILI